MRVAQAFPSIQEVRASNQGVYASIMDLINDNQDAIALFVKTPEGVISLVDNIKEMAIEENSIIAYIGRPMDFEDVLTSKMSEPSPED